MSAPAFTVGQTLPELSYPITRVDLIKYAGASGDFNPIHWSDRIATQVGLPGVIAHGMFTMALAARAVADWTDDAEVIEFSTKFTNPVVVPDDDQGASVRLIGTVKEVSEGRVTIALEARCGDAKVLGMPKVVIRG